MILKSRFKTLFSPTFCPFRQFLKSKAVTSDWLFVLEVKWFLPAAIEYLYMSKVRDKAIVLSDHLLMFVENFRER